MPIKPPDLTNPFPTDSMLRRGKKMHVKKQGENEWLVYEPGHEYHLVKKDVKLFTCDCTGFTMRNVCSHIAAVRLQDVEKDRTDLFG